MVLLLYLQYKFLKLIHGNQEAQAVQNPFE